MNAREKILAMYTAFWLLLCWGALAASWVRRWLRKRAARREAAKAAEKKRIRLLSKGQIEEFLQRTDGARESAPSVRKPDE